jgi:hypothetical protein
LLLCLPLSAEESPPAPEQVLAAAQEWVRAEAHDWVFDAAGWERGEVLQFLDAARQQIEALPAATHEPGREEAKQLVAAMEDIDALAPYSSWFRSLINTDPPLAMASPQATNAPTPTASSDNRAFWLSVLARRPTPTRAGEYLPQLKPIFQSECVPAELVWVAEVESAFNPKARSPVGAVGLFQLMPQTAESLGLSTWLPDERRDVEKNARAAAQYLQHLHARFGEWRLALAAYNAGPTRVARLLRKASRDSYEAIAAQLPGETRDYVAKVEATLLVREGIELAALGAPRAEAE